MRISDFSTLVAWTQNLRLCSLSGATLHPRHLIICAQVPALLWEPDKVADSGGHPKAWSIIYRHLELRVTDKEREISTILHE